MLFGLKYLHENDVIHLDIKPGNVLIDNLGCVKLADFGASRKLEDGRSVRVGSSGSKQSDTVEMLGTPYFMAPEIIRQERHGRKADIWSVAGTVLNMFTGVPPWAGSKSRSSNVMALLLQIEKAKGPPPYPNELQSPFTSGPDETPDVSILFPL
jgi:serine/threonine protein kinase